ncbi:uncharacterized protein BJX67DRAFT_380234 [Aspergillus lucknowensis]|uniref:Glycine-rich protein n=1 Tax=Aspergillus lucknowensis TaxID=176173 RepID=A0ABR4LYN8_9EURO
MYEKSPRHNAAIFLVSTYLGVHASILLGTEGCVSAKTVASVVCLSSPQPHQHSIITRIITTKDRAFVMASKQSSKPSVYLHNGQILQAPPLSVQIRRFIESIYIFFGLYFTSFFSLDPYTAAQNSPFNVTKSANQPNTKPRWSGSRGPRGGGGGGGGDGPGGGGFGSFGSGKFGRVDDVRGQCKGGCC